VGACARHLNNAAQNAEDGSRIVAVGVIGKQAASRGRMTAANDEGGGEEKKAHGRN